LIDAPCTSSTVAELRRILAITPNIGNIELARSGEIYWSSLLGVPPPGTEIREERSLYLTTSPPPLRVIPLSCFTCTRRAMGSIPAQTVTISATFWISASELSPVVLLTDHGWMGHDGIKVAQNLYLDSKAYSYWLSSTIDARDIIVFLLKREGIIILIFTIFVGEGPRPITYVPGDPAPPNNCLFQR